MRCACSPRTTARRASSQPQISQAPSAKAGGRNIAKLRTALIRGAILRVELRFVVLLRGALFDRLLDHHVLDQNEDHPEGETP